MSRVRRAARRRATTLVIALAVAALALAGVAAYSTAGAQPSTPAGASAHLLSQRTVPAASPAAKREQITTLKNALARIRAQLASGSSRWGDLDLRDVLSYHVDRLWTRGIDGYGTAVAVLEGWNYPGMQADLNALDDQVGLPHATVETVYPNGPLPAQCPAGMVKLGSYGSCDAWQGELELDVEAVHLMAPYAKIVISATPSDSEITGDPSSEVAMPEIVKGMEYLSTHNIANVMSISDGSSETDYSRGAKEIHAQDVGEVTAAAHGVPIANATGDCGAAQNLTTATRQCGTVSSGPASATWADSPWITAVGGSSPKYVGEGAAKTFPLDPIEGAGLSEMYPRPAYQDGVARITGSTQRSLPDITMNSRDGTSEAAPLFAGVLALATQVKGANLGPINEVLYGTLGKHAASDGLVDVTSGNNDFGTIPGYTATKGYDVASGWGTVNAARFAPALAEATRGNPMTGHAVQALKPFGRTLALTPSSAVAPGSPLDITSRGFLPDHPVTLAVDGTTLATVTADTSGNITYAFRPQDKGLIVGRHTLTVHSLLLDQSATFTVTG
ncbi:hypothetical protein [uncultured Jatrophihabitans sp.]|uniref:S53 family peptidase n=1 Tax=uncultured Jatrophihabitans sp. TaxID=1610747 RepID=UPI0035CABCF6